MSRYTTEIRYICVSLSGVEYSVGYKNVSEVIEKSRDKIFPSFDLFDENYRSVLETKILKHFYTREIGFETFGLWQLKLDAKLSVIMPYYNKIYKAVMLDIPVIENVDVTRKHEGKKNDDSTSIGSANSNTDTTSEDKSKVKYSDTPQGALTDLENDAYMSSATISDSTQKSNSKTEQSNTSTANAKTTEEYVERITGKQGSQNYISMINEYVEKLKNVDMMIINELEDLFMQVWDIWE